MNARQVIERQGETLPLAELLDSQPLRELVAPRAADVNLRAAFQTDGVVATRAVEKGLDAIEAHDRRAVDPHEHRRIELLRESLHALAHGERLFPDVQLG